jgi:hypothetical protein
MRAEMNRESLAKLRLDRRLIQRRGWISTAERKHALDELPDTSRKATTLGAASDERGGSERSAPDEAKTSGG